MIKLRFASFSNLRRTTKFTAKLKDSIFTLILVNNISWKRWACGTVTTFSLVQGVTGAFFIVSLTKRSVEGKFCPGTHCHA